MTIYTYSIELPYQAAVLNKRAYYKLPRSILLPPYLAINPYFVEYTDAVDTVFDWLVDAKIDALVNVRNMWATNKNTESKIVNGEMLEYTDWGGVERATVVTQVNLLGMKLANAQVVSELSYRTISRFIGQYWFEKGKATAMDFLNFCLNTQFTVSRMWTTDYVDFYEETDPVVGSTVYDHPQGAWYPTTHVGVTMPGDYTIDPIVLANFFYEICNYNLVLKIITNFYDCPIVSEDSTKKANIVATVAESEQTWDLDSNSYFIPVHTPDADYVGVTTGLIQRTWVYFANYVGTMTDTNPLNTHSINSSS